MRLSLPYRLKLASALSVRVGALGGVCWALAAPLQAQTVVPAAPIGNATEASETDSAFWSRQERLEAAQIPSLQKRAQSAREMWNKASAPALAQLRAQPVSAATVGVTFAGQQTRSAAQWEVAAPRVALAFYGRWLTQEAQQLWPQGQAASRAPGAESYTWVQVCSIAAQLQARDLGEPRGALAIYDWALQSGADIVALSRLELERDQLIAAQRDQFTPAALPAAASVAVPQVGPMPPQANEQARSSWPAPLQPQASPAAAQAPMITLSTAATSPLPATSPQTITLPKVATSPQMMTPATIAVGTPSPVLDAAFVRSSAALGQIRAGVLSPEEAWQRGLLTASNTGRLIWSAEIAAKEHKALRLRLAGLLAERAPEVLGPGTAAPGELKRLAGDYFRSQKDERAVAFLEAALAEWLKERQAKQKSWTVGDLAGAKSADPPWVAALANLAMFYSETGQFLKSAQTWERAEAYSRSPAWGADAKWEGARSYRQAGDTEKADALYLQVSSYAVDRYSGLAARDQSHTLILKGDYKAAQEVLERFLASQKGQAPEVMPGVLAYLAYAYYRAGEFEMAERISKEAIAHRQGLSLEALRILTRYGMDGQSGILEEVLRWIPRWKQQAIIVAPKQLRISTGKEAPGAQLLRRFKVRTLKDVPLTATTNHLHVQVQVANELPTSNDVYMALLPLYTEKEVFVQITPEAMKAANLVIIISSSQHPGFQTQVPILFDE